MSTAADLQHFTCSYEFEGRRYAVHIEARDFKEASRRLRAIGMTAQADGIVVAEGTLWPNPGWLRRIFG